MNRQRKDVLHFMAGIYLLLLPAYQRYRTKDCGDAINLFNRASYYPPVLFVAVVFQYLN